MLPGEGDALLGAQPRPDLEDVGADVRVDVVDVVHQAVQEAVAVVPVSLRQLLLRQDPGHDFAEHCEHAFTHGVGLSVQVGGQQRDGRTNILGYLFRSVYNDKIFLLFILYFFSPFF